MQILNHSNRLEGSEIEHLLMGFRAQGYLELSPWAMLEGAGYVKLLGMKTGKGSERDSWFASIRDTTLLGTDQVGSIWAEVRRKLGLNT
jgi:hypothetical protein